jgi:hypothetical protein
MTPRAQQRAAWQWRLRREKTAPSGIHVHIAEMEVRGASRLAARRMADTFQADLGRLIATSGVPAQWLSRGAIEHLHAPGGRPSLAQAVFDAGKEPSG